MGRATFVLGKGGVGRTTIARAMALRASEERPTVLIATGPSAANDRVSANLEVRRMDPKRLLDDAVKRLIPLGPLTAGLLKHPVYESMTEIAPALRELALLDAIEDTTRGSGPEVIVDGPATGHGLHFLEAPDKAVEVLVGRLRHRAAKVRDALRDPERFRVVLVTIPEELPVIETIELLDHLRRGGFEVPVVLINRVPPPLPVEVEATYPGDVSGATPVQALTLLRGARETAEAWIERLEAAHDNVVRLPFVPDADAIEDDLATFLGDVV